MDDNNEHYAIKCNKLHGKIILKCFSSRIDCIECEHGLVKPATFERLAGRGLSKSWRRSVRCARTNTDIYTLIELGVLKPIDEERKVRPASTEGTDSSTSEDVVKRKSRGPGRPRKVERVDHDKVEHDLASPDMSSPEPHKGKRKRKNQVATSRPTTEVSSLCTTPERVKASRKLKRTRCNNFEKSLNSVIRESRNPLATYRVTCSICETALRDSEALKYHDIMFHSSVSSKLFVTEDPQNSLHLTADIIPPESSSSNLQPVLTNTLETTDDQLVNDNDNDHLVNDNELIKTDPDYITPSPSEESSETPWHTPLETPTNTDHICEAAQDPEVEDSTSDQTTPPNTRLLETVSSQYKEIIGLSRETLHQNSMVKSKLDELTQSINEIRSEVKDMSRSLSDSDHYKPVNKSHDDVTELEYKTFFKVLDKFISKNGNPNGNGKG